MKVSVKMPAEEFERYLRYCKDKHDLKKELKIETLGLQQQLGRLCFAVIQGIEITEQGDLQIRSLPHLAFALAQAIEWQQRQ